MFLSALEIYSPIHPASHLTDIWYNIEIVEVLIVQIADYVEHWNDSNYVRSILRYSNK